MRCRAENREFYVVDRFAFNLAIAQGKIKINPEHLHAYPTDWPKKGCKNFLRLLCLYPRIARKHGFSKASLPAI
jgi:hypothetical protein